jgi:hypothetical protein
VAARIISFTLPDTAFHTLLSVLPAMPPNAIQPNRVNNIAIRASSANSGSAQINLGTANYTTDGTFTMKQTDNPLTIGSSVNNLDLQEYVIKGSAAGVIVDLSISWI